ncbi:MAG: peptidoglycan D,D-transpeptidase FtsI family protein [Candidatus Aminicenantales bacterium]
MRDLFTNGVRPRALFIALIFAIWFAGIFARLVSLQIIDHAKLKTEVLEQSQNEIEVLPRRGTIYDRNGKILARSLPVASVYYSSLKDETPEAQMSQVGRAKDLLELSEKDLSRIRSRIRKKSGYILIKRKIDPEKAERVMALSIKGLFLQEENKRFYPQGSLAAHILGGVGIDDNGLAGVELQYDALLRGRKGTRLIMRDARRKSYNFETLKEAVPGGDLYLTIDETIQYIAESELEKAVTTSGAKWGTVIVADPSSGEILAMANRPAYDPNDYPPALPEDGRNRAVQNTFEPGSTFKIVTAAAARELGNVGLGETYDCRAGAIIVGGSPVKDHTRLGVLSFPEVFIESSNVGTIMIAEEIGESKLYQMIKTFHFGEKTGIDLPGEEVGICRPLSRWRRSSLRIAIGYEISVTALQILRAMNVYATRGLLVKPTIARLDVEAGGPEAPDAAAPENIISKKTASELAGVFQRVVDEGTGLPAKLDGFDIAGKTGTAQKLDPAIGRYTSSKHLASFVGFVPVDHPLLSMIVVLDEPRGFMQYGGQVSAPVFRNIADRVLRYFRAVPKPKPESPFPDGVKKASLP